MLEILFLLDLLIDANTIYSSGHGQFFRDLTLAKFMYANVNIILIVIISLLYL